MDGFYLLLKQNFVAALKCVRNEQTCFIDSRACSDPDTNRVCVCQRDAVRDTKQQQSDCSDVINLLYFIAINCMKTHISQCSLKRMQFNVADTHASI